MSPMSYDPYNPPAPDDWLALDEQARIDLVQRYHQMAGQTAGNMTVHAAVHTVIENQIALNDPPEVAKKLRSLMAEGLDRHEAVHALSTAVTDMLWGLSRAKAQSGDPMQRYVNSVRRLSMRKWLRLG